ncbi:MAG: hypothetical protein QM673_16060 [Gordonia sp. (in: high G+C Gram-positive bacteria)]
MRLTTALHTPRRYAMFKAIGGGRFGRGRSAERFPAEAERLVTAAELKRLTA